MKKNHSIVLSHLSALAQAASPDDLKTQAHAITTKTLFNALDPAEQGELGGIDNTAKVIDYLRRKDLVDNGLSEIDKGRTVLTWVITDKGHLALNGSIPDPTAQDDKPIQHEATDIDADDCIAEAITPQLLTLNPADPQDRIFVDMIAQIRAAEAAKPVQKIARRQIKIETLNRLAAITSADIADVLADIAVDLDAIDAEAA